MQEAYDNILQTIVSAKDAVVNFGFEPYRFECPFCGEEVHLSAPFSIKKSSHFRHLHGNNSIDCEKYLGIGFVAGSTDRRKKGYREVADIIFNSSNTTFALRIRFSEEEINHYEEKGSVLEIRNSSGRPFRKVQINHTNFVPGFFSEFILDVFSDRYYVCIDDQKEHVYEFMMVNDSSFFRIYGDDVDYYAKRLSSVESVCVVYSNTRYLVLSLNPYEINVLKAVLKDSVKKEFKFDTMKGFLFYGFEFQIERYDTYLIEALFAKGYRLERNDSLQVIWPPCYSKEEMFYSSKDDCFISSSFEIHQHSGNNIDSESIHRISDNLTRIEIKSGIRITRKNTELQLQKEQLNNTESPLNYETVVCTCYVVPEEGVAVLFDKDGASCLASGKKVFMSPDKIIIRYLNNMPIEIVKPIIGNEMLVRDRIIDAEKYYRRYISIDDTTESVISDLVKKGLKIKENSINAAVFQMLQKGII